MLLSKILIALKERDNISFNTKLYLKKLKKKLFFLIEIKNSKKFKFINRHLYLKKTIFDSKTKQDLINYIIHINFSETNTLVCISDIKGNPKFSLSSGILKLKGKQKTHQPTAIVKIFKTLFTKIKFVSTKPVALHFINAKRFHIFLVLNLLKDKIFIKTIRNYNLKSYNGCRPKKIKRIKQRKKQFF